MNTDLGTLEYQRSMNALVLAAEVVETLPLQKMLSTVDTADAVGPVLYPTEYRQASASGSLDAQRKILEAGRALVAALAELKVAAS